MCAGYWYFHHSRQDDSMCPRASSDECYSSIIIQSNSITDVLKYAHHKDTLVVFDLDNTLIHPNQDLGGDAWFNHLMKQKTETGMSYEDALALVLPFDFYVMDHLRVYPVEEATPGVLDTLGKQGIVFIGLTARSLPLISRTHEQLKEAGLQLTDSPIFDREISFNFNKPAVLHHGIIFCNNVNKGTVLVQVLRACNFNPATIIFVDDKLSHLLEVQKECLANNMRFIGLRYGKLDDAVAQFDPVRAEEQLAALLSGSKASGKPVPAPVA